jgi:hypothetical protein
LWSYLGARTDSQTARSAAVLRYRKTAPAPIALEALRQIAGLYEIEVEIRGKNADERRTSDRKKLSRSTASMASCGATA